MNKHKTLTSAIADLIEAKMEAYRLSLMDPEPTEYLDRASKKALDAENDLFDAIEDFRYEVSA